MSLVISLGIVQMIYFVKRSVRPFMRRITWRPGAEFSYKMDLVFHLLVRLALSPSMNEYRLF